MDTALSIIEQLTCTYLKAETAERIYDARDGYSTVFVDPFSKVTSVTVDGKPVEYTKMFWNRKNSNVFNSIVLDCPIGNKEVTINATWVIPDELEELETKLEGLLSKNVDGRVKSKRVEDFQITYADTTVADQFELDNQAILSKYSLCGVGNIRSGEVCGRYGL